MDIIVELYDHYFDMVPVLRTAIKSGKGIYMRYIPEEERESYGIEPDEVDQNNHYIVIEEKGGELWFFKLSKLFGLSKEIADDLKPIYTVKLLTDEGKEYFTNIKREDALCDSDTK